MKHQTTIIDIAKQLNLSKSTVSRALTNHPGINKETKKAVLDLAKKLDYQKNMLATSLVTNKSYTIGIIVPEFFTSFFTKFIIGAQEVAHQHGYSVIVSQSNENFKTEIANTEVMLANRVDGLLISLTKETHTFEHLKVFQRKGIPLVFFNRVCNQMPVPKVIVDDYDGAFKLVEHLIARGRKRIAHIAGPQTLTISRNRLNGYRDALVKHRLPFTEELIVPYNLSPATLKRHVDFLLSLPCQPDAIFAVNDPAAIEIIQILLGKGIKIPEDVAVVGFSNDYASAMINPSLTTVAQPVLEMGRTATRFVLEQIKQDQSDWKAVTKVLKTELIIRKSS